MTPIYATPAKRLRIKRGLEILRNKRYGLAPSPEEKAEFTSINVEVNKDIKKARLLRLKKEGVRKK